MGAQKQSGVDRLVSAIASLWRKSASRRVGVSEVCPLVAGVDVSQLSAIRAPIALSAVSQSPVMSPTCSEPV